MNKETFEFGTFNINRMSNSSTQVIRKAQELRQNFRSVYRSKYILRDPACNLSLKSYEFTPVTAATSPHAPKKSVKSTKNSLNSKERFLKSPTVRKYLRYKLFSLPNAGNYSIKYNHEKEENQEREAQPSEVTQNIVRNKLKINLRLPICRPSTRDSGLCRSSGALNYLFK